MEKKFKKIYIEITNICNLNCSFCPDTKREKSFIFIEKFEKISKQVKDYTNLIALHVKGEPLMHPELKQILLACEENNLQVNVTTNGTLLFEKKDVLANSQSLRQLNISLHSISQNSKMDKVEYINNILNAVKYITSKKDVYISYRLWNLKNISENDENIYILDRLSDEYGITNLKEIAKENEFVELGNKIFLNQDIEFKWPDMDNKEVSDTGTCQGLRSQLAILVNGDVVPCCLDQEGVIKLGSIFENTLDEILNSELSAEIKKGFEENRIIHELCKKCEYRVKFDTKGRPLKYQK